MRIGNAAHAQLQLDVYGELIDAFHQARMAELKLDDGTWDLECAVLEHLAEVWDQPDHGIWERRGEPRHYVFSKVMTWVAFDRAIKSVETVRLRRRRSSNGARCATPFIAMSARKGFDSEAERLRRVLWLATARCQHSAVAVGRLPAGRPMRASAARSRRSSNT